MSDQQAAILIVEDETSLRELLMTFMRRYFACADTESAEGAIELLAGRRFDLAIVDVFLPGQSGIDLCKHIREQYPDMEIICISGTPSYKYDAAAIGIGAFDFIHKPFEFPRLLETVNQALAYNDFRRQQSG